MDQSSRAVGSVLFVLLGVVRGNGVALPVLVWLGFDDTEEWGEDLPRGQRAGRVRVWHVWETSGGPVRRDRG